MICFLRELITLNPNEATLSRTVDHIVYVGETIGYEHVGIGSDFDGMLRGPDGLEDTTRYPYLVAELLQRGVAESDVKNVLGWNILRVLRETERVARVMKKRGAHAAVDTIEPFWKDEIKQQLKDERARVEAVYKSHS
jgi:membrane dipeptidase